MNELQQLERYIQGTLETEERLLLEAQLILNAGLQDKLHWQKKTYALIGLYGRKKLRTEIEQVQNRLFTAEKFKDFQKKIKTIFQHMNP